jgi:hypothetical protein
MRFALVTPSFRLDYDVCRILIDSVHRFVPADVVHYLVVSSDDADLFSRCADARTRVLTQEDVVPERFWRVPFAQQWRVRPGTIPVRPWIWQQMVKLSIANRIDADAYMILDSDCLFVQPFDPRSLTLDGKVPLFREEKDWYRTNASSQKWVDVSRRMLRLPPFEKPFSVGYINSLVFWRRDVLQELHAHVANGRGPTALIRAAASSLRFSEYTLYGLYVEKVLGLAQSGHYAFGCHLSHDYWPEIPMNQGELEAFKTKRTNGDIIVMINAKSRTPPMEIRKAFGF